MSTSPQLPVPENVWARFSADPRTQGEVRASDADRDVAAEALNAAFGDGRLDSAEHADRLASALGAKKLGEIVPLLSDIVVSQRRASARGGTVEERGRIVKDGAVRSWLGLALLFNVIWVATWLFSGDAPYYYWPIWPMIGTAVPAIIAWLSGHAVAQRPADPERDQRRADRARRRQLDR